MARVMMPWERNYFLRPSEIVAIFCLGVILGLIGGFTFGHVGAMRSVALHGCADLTKVKP